MSRGLRRWLSKHIVDIILIFLFILVGIVIAWMMSNFGGVHMVSNCTLDQFAKIN